VRGTKEKGITEKGGHISREENFRLLNLIKSKRSPNMNFSFEHKRRRKGGTVEFKETKLRGVREDRGYPRIGGFKKDEGRVMPKCLLRGIGRRRRGVLVNRTVDKKCNRRGESAFTKEKEKLFWRR